MLGPNPQIAGPGCRTSRFLSPCINNPFSMIRMRFDFCIRAENFFRSQISEITNKTIFFLLALTLLYLDVHVAIVLRLHAGNAQISPNKVSPGRLSFSFVFFMYSSLPAALALGYKALSHTATCKAVYVSSVGYWKTLLTFILFIYFL